jgi:coproporphyrinogen III oxidase-like Fe-S oxidoreductase
MKTLISNKPYIVRTIYLKINSLNLLNTNELDIILNELAYPVSEFTIECDVLQSFTKEKLQLLKNHGVTRLSISLQPQQKQQKKNLENDIVNFYKNTMQYDFKININIFAGLPYQSLKSFKNEVDILLELSPDNITVYSYENNSDEKKYLEFEKMMNYVQEKLKNENYKPYCISKRLNFGKTYEDLFYCKESATCIFNVDNIEETCSVIACGVNAISNKVYYIEQKQEKLENPKSVNDYLEKLDKIIYNKNKLFK